ncbi:Phage integrase, N-terminal SAM-like domain [Gracilibacillus ureilyticus]|uniref:Phage integrase, N-terminal SAM-like domain n=1 Tax=Gracilibacillus ureilyticus TaxID=531814 RepID=A0A1H9TB23_9BACI|nr:phage integrase SAM-like domain-containing protein [Gracilibacillus ureilyticus]SER94422.1 Phage integrase, N-terminal SAM-like domain [Gracilibacillus ureilyticus]
MASIIKKGKGYGYSICNMEDGKQKPIRKFGLKTIKEARIAANEIENMLAKGALPQLEPLPFNKYFNKWTDLYKKDIFISTRNNYNYSGLLLKNFFGNMPIQKIDRDKYQEFLNSIGENRAKETVQKVNDHIRSCVENAVIDQIIPHNFTRKTNIYYTNDAKSPVEKHLNVGDSQRLYKTLYERIINEGKKSGLSTYMVFLALARYTHASVLLSKGLPLQYVSERLGHRNIDTTKHLLDLYSTQIEKIQ